MHGYNTIMAKSPMEHQNPCAEHNKDNQGPFMATAASLQDTNKAFALLCLLQLTCLVAAATATQFRVGGSQGWTVPSEPDEYNNWAERMRFQIGDSLLFEYPASKDSVLQVTREDYESCNTQTPIAIFDDGSTIFMFDRSGSFFFISGVRDNCLKKEALIVVVMADRSNRPPPRFNDPGSTPPLGSIEFVPTPPQVLPNAAASSMTLAGVVSFALVLICPCLLLFL